jgi:hypothetical protein
MRTADARGFRTWLGAGLLVLAAAPASASSPRATAATAPLGASALDALGVLREAEARSYRLDDDAVRTLAMRVESPAIDDLTTSGGPLSGRDVRITLWWNDGDVRVVVDGVDGADPVVVASLEALVRPLPALLLPQRPSRGLVGSSFGFVKGESLLRPGDRGIEAVTRAGEGGVSRVVLAISSEGLLVGERIERVDGRSSEFRHQWILQGGRYLLRATDGWLAGRRVGAELTWGDLVGERPVPTHVIVLQGDLLASWPESARGIEFRLSEHRINVEPPAGLYP